MQQPLSQSLDSMSRGHSQSNFALQWPIHDPSASQYPAQTQTKPMPHFQSSFSLSSAGPNFFHSADSLTSSWIPQQPLNPQNQSRIMSAPVSARVIQTTEDADMALRLQMLAMLRQQAPSSSFNPTATMFQQRPTVFPGADTTGHGPFQQKPSQPQSQYQMIEQSFLAHQLQQQQLQHHQPWQIQQYQQQQQQQYQAQQPQPFQPTKQLPPLYQQQQSRLTPSDSTNDFSQLTPLERSMLADSPISYHTQVSTPAFYASTQDPSPYSSYSVPSSSSTNSQAFKLPLLCGSSGAAQSEPLSMLPPTLPVDTSSYAYASASAQQSQRAEVSPAQSFGPNPFAAEFGTRPYVQVSTESAGVQTYHSAVTPSDILFESTLAYRAQSHGTFPTSVGSLSSFAPLGPHMKEASADGLSLRINDKPMDSYDNDTGSSASCTDLLSNLTEVTASPSPKNQPAVRPKASRIPSDSTVHSLTVKVESAQHSPIPILPLPSPTTSVNSVGKSPRAAPSKKGGKSPRTSLVVAAKAAAEPTEKMTATPVRAKPSPSAASSASSARTRTSARLTPSRSAKRKFEASEDENEEEAEEEEEEETGDEEYDDSDEEYDEHDSDLDSPQKKKKKQSGKKNTKTPSKIAKSAAASVEAEDEDAYHSAIICGHSQPDPSVEPTDELGSTHFSDFFNKVVPVYTASNDAGKRVLYRARDLATHMNCDVSNLCMFLKRLPNKLELGVYQATSIQDKYDCNPGLKKGAYFVTKEVCEKFASRRVHKRHSKPRSTSRGARRKVRRGGKAKRS